MRLPRIVLPCVALTVCFAASVLTAAEPASAGTIPKALAPEVQTAEWAQSWWMPRHEQKLAEKKALGTVDLVWIGDSITHAWEDTGKATWAKHYAHRHALNLGFSGDRTEQVLWRLEHGEVDEIAPKAVVVMIGTNNTGHRQDPASETAAGVKAIVTELKTRLPSAKILLLGVFPRGETNNDPLRKLNVAINAELAKLADGTRVTYLDIGDKFLTADGMLPKSIMPDMLHPNAEGYEMWADAIEPTLKTLLGE